ncbi:crooked isoform X2 [Nomia melanderi]|uniref:crooked isoform X2 n=1 Tax=Nomia melanderi TaxID=2448451 RepID=UPI0013047440|nr:uncharacterized protein LOC116431926 isoform X2 [Nomia melanderi]
MTKEISIRVLVTALFFLFCIHQGFSIKCWVCRSDSDPKCADPFDNTTVPITDCKQEPELEHLPGVKPTMCRKIRQKDPEWPEYSTRDVDRRLRDGVKGYPMELVAEVTKFYFLLLVAVEI